MSSRRHVSNEATRATFMRCLAGDGVGNCDTAISRAAEVVRHAAAVPADDVPLPTAADDALVGLVLEYVASYHMPPCESEVAMMARGIALAQEHEHLRLTEESSCAFESATGPQALVEKCCRAHRGLTPDIESAVESLRD